MTPEKVNTCTTSCWQHIREWAGGKVCSAWIHTAAMPCAGHNAGLPGGLVRSCSFRQRCAARSSRIVCNMPECEMDDLGSPRNAAALGSCRPRKSGMFREVSTPLCSRDHNAHSWRNIRQVCGWSAAKLRSSAGGSGRKQCCRRSCVEVTVRHARFGQAPMIHVQRAQASLGYFAATVLNVKQDTRSNPPSRFNVCVSGIDC